MFRSQFRGAHQEVKSPEFELVLTCKVSSSSVQWVLTVVLLFDLGKKKNCPSANGCRVQFETVDVRLWAERCNSCRDFVDLFHWFETVSASFLLFLKTWSCANLLSRSHFSYSFSSTVIFSCLLVSVCVGFPPPPLFFRDQLAAIHPATEQPASFFFFSKAGSPQRFKVEIFSDMLLSPKMKEKINQQNQPKKFFSRIVKKKNTAMHTQILSFLTVVLIVI